VSKSFTISAKPALSIAVNPTTSDVGKQVVIAVTSGNAPVAGASIFITKPDGTKTTLTTGTDGTKGFTPDRAGTYQAAASKDGYKDTTESFLVNSGLELQLPAASSIVFGGEITITVVDAGSKDPVANAMVSGTGITDGTRTDYLGQFKVRLAKSGQYNFAVLKDGYGEGRASLVVQCTLNLKMNATGAEISQSVLAKAYDKEKGDYTEANFAITLPDGSSDSKTDASYVLVPEMVGSYKIAVSKANCIGEEASIDVSKRPLSIETGLKDGNIVIRTVSNGRAVSGVSVDITTPSGLKDARVSDDSGLITIVPLENGNYTITANDALYAEKTVSIERQSSALKKYWWVLLVGGVLALIIILLIVLVVLFMRSRHKAESSFGKGRGSSIG
ncbi:MAG: carboxypeptidase-like regulatory domain-containing protein, partial [Candidatus Altiarchaeota archaeon]|nr:carboxypeptidase-like regulatory domain-containing protein [Candidatus Altiarchaeota archaeon]